MVVYLEYELKGSNYSGVKNTVTYIHIPCCNKYSTKLQSKRKSMFAYQKYRLVIQLFL